MKKIKLIWDFRGGDAKGTAEHHRIHLEEYAEREKLELTESGVEEISGMHYIAYLLVVESEMIQVRDALVPHRGQLV